MYIQVLIPADPQTLIARGGALIGSGLIHFHDVVTKAIGVGADNDEGSYLMNAIIEVNTQLGPEGARNKKSDFFLRLGRKFAYMEVYEGNHPNARENILLYRLKIDRNDFLIQKKMYIDVEICIHFDGTCEVKVYFCDNQN